jgi:chromate transport protein ChrA
VLRLVAMALFGLMFVAEAWDAFGHVLTLADPGPSAERFGITVGAEIIRTAILLFLALIVTLGSLIAVVGLQSRRAALFHRGALACALGYVVYGLYQMAEGALQIGSGVVVVVGLIYVVLGGLAYAMHRTILAI